MAEKGQLSINSENMFPIIKKWLYSDHDIFYREIISNGCDAITKLKKLQMMGEAERPADWKARIDVVVDPKERTIAISDNGIGMTADEVREYINNIAFSGAEAFMEKYKDKANDDQIIGHFGLGFYSAFMVSELVEIETLSWQEGAQPVHWACDGGSEYTMDDGSRTEIGTTVIMHLSEDCVEFANYYRAQEVIEKYCGFMSTEIYLSEKDTDRTETIKESERRPDDIVIEVIPPKDDEKDEDEDDYDEDDEEDSDEEESDDGEEDGSAGDGTAADGTSDASSKGSGSSGDSEETEVSEAKPAKPKKENQLKIRKRPELVNDPNPLWTKAPKDCTDEEYKAFYRKLFNDYKEPLFWIHLNMDYPFNLKGILYFPKINLEYESAEGVIKLYNNQVFIADNIKEVIPEFLMLLKGVIDCPDLPLNVSRSALQNDGFAQKISDYITKKVADKLAGMCRTDKDNYDKYWDDISPFIKYGCLKDDKFCQKMTDYILFKDLDGKYLTLPDALEVNKTDPDAPKEDAGAGSAVDGSGSPVVAEIVDENGNPIVSEDSTADAQTGSDAQILDENGNPIVSEESAADAEAEGAAQSGTPGEGDSAESEEEEKLEVKERTIYYVTDEQQQGQYIRMFRKHKLQAFILNSNIDSPFIQQLESKNENIHFERIDAGVDEVLQGRTGKKTAQKLEEQGGVLEPIVRKAIGNDKLKVKLENLKDKNVSSLLKVDEQNRRMQEMMKMYGMSDMSYGAEGETLILNAKHPLVKFVLEDPESEMASTVCEQLYDLAKIQNAPLTSDEMERFISRSNTILMTLTGAGEKAGEKKPAE